MKEIYKDITGYEGKYQVSDLGNVRSLDRKVHWKDTFIKSEGVKLKPYLTGKGYLTVRLYKNKTKKDFVVHKLVAITFLNHKPNGMKIVVDHIDNNRLNNNVNNLQLISNRENSSKDKKGCSSKYTGVSWHKHANKWVAQIRIKGKVKNLGCFINEIDASNAYQSTLKTII